MKYKAHEESHIESLRRQIEQQYKMLPDAPSHDFDELLCYEIHVNGLTFRWLAEKWGLSLPTLGALIHDHCMGLEELPKVNHKYKRE